MTRYWRGNLAIIVIEATLVAGCILAPGAGHSPLLYTQLPAMMVVAPLAPNAGPCFSCAPGAWAVGVVAELLLFIALWTLIDGMLRSRARRMDTHHTHRAE